MATFAVEGWSLALTRDDPANSSSTAIITGITTLAIRTFFFVICPFP
jgi:hypothetical protein